MDNAGIKVHCDDCGWEDTVSALRHLRAWYHAACPECGQGELIDAVEVRVSEELIAMEAIGWVTTDLGSMPEGVRAHLDTARKDILRIVE
jgi:predicted RNA-binding Zn-ribbon protein involved in translation (DUF1610 family)